MKARTEPELRIISLGAGVQSSTMFLMSDRGDLETADAAVFADTGWEPPVVYEWLNMLEKISVNIPIFRTSGGNIREDALVSQVRGKVTDGRRWASMPFFTKDRKTGKRGMIRRQCTNEYKLRPIRRLERELLGKGPRERIAPKSVEQWIGISLDEVSRMKPSDVKWVYHRWPLIELRMSREDCQKWLVEQGYGPAPRSACVGCPFHNDREWKEIRKDPGLWRDAIEFDKAIRKLDGMRGDVFLHSKRIPLSEVDFGDDDTVLFNQECEGMCGV